MKKQGFIAMSTLRAKLYNSVSLPRRLARNQQGNVTWIMAFALIPLISLVGAGVDMTRAYLAKTRLQAACDSGVLAGRKSISGTNYTVDNKQTALDHFKVNYGLSEFQSTNVSFNSERLPSGEVTGNATAALPTAIMFIIGKKKFDLSASCGARMDLTNADIMFVLDTTGTMSLPAGSQTRIEALRTAVKNFTGVMTRATNADTRVRYGFVPFSSSVNVGGLLKPEWLADRWQYQSRQKRGEIVDEKPIESLARSTWNHVGGTRDDVPSKLLPPENCIAPPNTMTWVETVTKTEWETLPDGRKVEVIYFITESNGSMFKIRYENDACYLDEERRTGYKEEATRTKTERTAAEKVVALWDYKPVTFDVSSLKSVGSTVSLPIGTNGAAKTLTWNGCIEERKTVRDAISSSNEISPNAHDLNIGLVPDGRQETQWGPALGGAVFMRAKWDADGEVKDTDWQWDPVTHTSTNFVNVADFRNGNYVTCPSPSRKLGAMSEAEVASYVDGLELQGFTHLDIGMLWGARLLWPTGLFGAENSDAPNGQPITRNIIFMTDGDVTSLKQEYDAYGIAALDRRRTPQGELPDDDDQNELIEQRLAAICDTVKNRGITIWVVAFGTDLTDGLRQCASTDRAFRADDAAELNDTFQDIASKIGNLRVTR